MRRQIEGDEDGNGGGVILTPSFGFGAGCEHGFPLLRLSHLFWGAAWQSSGRKKAAAIEIFIVLFESIGLISNGRKEPPTK